MTITLVPITGFPTTGFPITTITPLTYRDGVTYLEKMELLRRWVEHDLVDWMETNVAGLETEWTTEVATLVTTINGGLAGLSTTVNDALTAEDVKNTAALQVLHDYVTTTVQQVINNSLEANDGIVQGLINNVASLTRIAFDAIYQHKDSVNDNAVAALLATATATQTAFDGRYFKSTGTVLDVTKGGSGRNTGAVANGVIVSGATADAPQATVAPGVAGTVLLSAGAGAVPAWGPFIDDTAAGASKTYSSNEIETLVGGKSLYGTYAARPLATAVKAGTLYACSDVPETYLASAGAWHVIGAGGNSLGSAESTPLVQNGGTAGAAVPGLTTTFIVGERPIRIDLTMRLANNLANGVSVANILFDEVIVARIEIPTGQQVSTWQTGYTFKRITGLVPGSTHTARVTINSTVAAGTALTAGDATNPNSLMVVTL